MTEMSPKQRFEAAMKLEGVDRVSCACPLQTGTLALMEASGAYWPEAHKDPAKMAKLALAAYEVAGIESARVPFHVDYESEAMGCVLGEWVRESQPQKMEFAIKSLDDIAKLKVPDPHKDGKMPVVLEAVNILSKKVGNKLPVIAAIAAPFEMAVRLGGLDEIMRGIINHPDELKKLMKITTQTGIEYGKALIESGASCITLVDGSSNCDVIGAEFYTEFSQPYAKEVIGKLKSQTVLHLCGNAQPILKELSATGATGISVDYVVDVAEAKKVFGKKTAVVGNVDPVGTLGAGTPEMVEKDARVAIEKGTDVLTSGCGFPPQTPLENMKVLVRTAQKYGKRK